MSSGYYDVFEIEEIPVNNISLREHLRLDQIRSSEYFEQCGCGFEWMNFGREDCPKCGRVL